MAHQKKILNFVDQSSYLFSGYILAQLKKKKTLTLIDRVIEGSDKTVAEAVIVFLSAIRYLSKDSDAFSSLEKTDSFQEFIKANEGSLIDLSLQRKVQGNLPERGLPLLEIFSKKIPGSSIAVIELGASYGLIGRCLLDPFKMIERKGRYFSQEQKIPENIKGIDYYLGIDLDPPDKEWLLISTWHERLAWRLRNLLEDLQPDPRFRVIKANAFGFPGLEPVRELLGKNPRVIVLTSFMLYQLDDIRQKQLKAEIGKFVEDVDGYWINQDVMMASVASTRSRDEYFIELNEKRIIDLPDDKCITWEWVVGG